MELAVGGVVVLVNDLEGVGTVAVHASVAIGCASVAEEEGHLVGGLLAKGQEVPEHVWILQGIAMKTMEGRGTEIFFNSPFK